jgi:hypothetical protein
MYQRPAPSHWTDFREIWYWRLSRKSFGNSLIFFYSGRKTSGTLHDDLSEFHVFGSDSIQSALLCFLDNALSMNIIAGVILRQQHKLNALLRFHGRNDYVKAPHCYFICTSLPWLIRECNVFMCVMFLWKKQAIRIYNCMLLALRALCTVS